MVTAILVLVAIAIAAGFTLIMRGSGERKERQDIKAAPRMKIADAQPGQALRLVGAVRLEDPLRSPLSGRSCAWYRVVVTRGPIEAPLLDVTDVRDFDLEDASGRAQILATGAVAFVTTTAWSEGRLPLAPEARALLEKHHIEVPLVASTPTLVGEQILEAGAQALVYGFVDLEAGTGGSYREASMKVVVRQALRITDDLSLA